MSEVPASPELREMFNAALYRQLASELAGLAPKFDRAGFLHHVLEGHADRSLMARMRQTAIAAQATLPGTYRDQLAVLRELAPRLSSGFVTIFLSEFVAQFGLQDFTASMDALHFFTRFGSAEFAVRPFLVADQTRMLTVMLRWAGEKAEDVRRLASEGCRPRLPWGLRLQNLVRDPAPLASILEKLKNDPSLYVRKSVANNLNDIAKDHPEWVLARLESWDLSSPRTAWIARHALRTLIKRGHPRALQLFGVKKARGISATLRLQPRKLQLGETLKIAVTLHSTEKKSQRLVVDYVIHYMKASGTPFAKVFKWTELDLAGGADLTLKKRQTIRDFTTRRHYAGRHLVEVQINGTRLASDHFVLAK